MYQVLHLAQGLGDGKYKSLLVNGDDGDEQADYHSNKGTHAAVRNHQHHWVKNEQKHIHHQHDAEHDVQKIADKGLNRNQPSPSSARRYLNIMKKQKTGKEELEPKCDLWFLAQWGRIRLHKSGASILENGRGGVHKGVYCARA